MIWRVVFCVLCCASFAGEQRQFGEAWSRNMVSKERGLPAVFDLQTGQNVKWVAELGTESYSTPVVAGGRVFVGTNNERPRDPRHQGDRGVFMCFDEETGKLLWQLVAPKLEEDPYHDWPKTGMSSPGTVEGNRIYLVSNRAQLLCLDVRGMANGNDGPFKDEGKLMTRRGTNGQPVVELEAGKMDADVIWVYDMFKEAGIWPHDGAHSAIMIRGNYLYLNTGTGVDNTHRKIRTPDAPSLIVVDKRTGKLVARDREKIAPNIFHATWSGPSAGRVDGKDVIFFLGGNGIVYGFEPWEVSEKGTAKETKNEKKDLTAEHAEYLEKDGVGTLRKLFEFDFDPSGPKEQVHRFTTNRREGPSNFYGMPVFVDGALYVAGGGDIFWGKNEAWLKKLEFAVEGGEVKVKEAWTFLLGKHVLSTPAVEDGLLYIADANKDVRCIDAKTGAEVWKHEAKGEFWSSPLVADGKVFIGSRKGDFSVFAAGREKKVLGVMEMKDPIAATAVAANGTLYIATMRNLYAIKEGASPAKLPILH
jgi:outer membrane protein assembly factor BamB